MSFFYIVSLHSDPLLVSFNDRLHLFFCTAFFLGYPTCTIFMVPQVIMRYGMCGSIADVRDYHHLYSRDLLVFPEQGIHPLVVLFYALCWWVAKLTFVHYTCLSRSKVFYLLVYLFLIHSAYSIIHHHLAIDFCRLDSLWPLKTHHCSLML